MGNDGWDYLTLPERDRDRLAALGSDGWELIGVGGDGDGRLLYLKRPELDFRERVTLDQRRRYYESRGLDPRPHGEADGPWSGGILNPALSHLLASAGHTDYVTICDRGFPVPEGPERIDLALVDDIPTVLDVLRAVHGEWSIDRVVITHEMAEVSPERVREMGDLLGDVELERVSHLELKRLGQGARGTVRTGDTVAYANVIVVSG